MTNTNKEKKSLKASFIISNFLSIITLAIYAIKQTYILCASWVVIISNNSFKEFTTVKSLLSTAIVYLVVYAMGIICINVVSNYSYFEKKDRLLYFTTFLLLVITLATTINFIMAVYA